MIGRQIFILGLFFISLVIILGSVLFHTYGFEPFTSENNSFWVGFELSYETIFYFLLYRSFKRISLGKSYKSKR